MPYYESVFIARQDITAAQVEGLIETFEKAITDGGGVVPKKESWGLRTLAYRIKKNRKGHYVLMNIDAPAEAIKEMERQMHINEDVIRHLTTQVLSYALCRKLGKGDQPVVEEITRKVLLQNATWTQLFIEVANSIPFRQTVYKVVKDGTKLEN